MRNGDLPSKWKEGYLSAIKKKALKNEKNDRSLTVTNSLSGICGRI